MAFTPQSAGLSTEPINAGSQGDWAFENSNIGIIDGSLTLIPSAGNTGGGAFPPLSWDAVLDLTNYTLPTDDWVLADRSGSGGAPWASDPTDVATYPWDNNAPYALKFDTTNPDDYFKISQLGSGTTFDAGTINTTTGLTVELEVLVESEQGLEAQGHTLYIGDGVKFWTFNFRPTGVQIGSYPSTTIAAADLTTYRTIRVGLKDGQATIGLDDGSVAVFDYPGSTLGNPAEIYYGKGGANPQDGAVSYLRNMKIFNGLAVDSSPDTTISYSTDPEVAISPAFAPSKAVRRFSGLSIATSGTSAIGESTKVQAQYNNSGVSDWTNTGFLTTISSDTTIDLTSVPTVGDGSDQVRFQFEMLSTGTDAPVAIDSLSLATVFEEALVRTFPNWGPTNGGNTVALELFNTQGLETPISAATTTEALYGFDETSGTEFADASDATLNFTASGVDLVAGEDSPLGGQLRVGTHGAAVGGETFSAGIDGAQEVIDPKASGLIGTSVVPVYAASSTNVVFSQVPDVDEANVSYVAQKCQAPLTGEGFQFEFDPGATGNAVAGLRLKIESGSVTVTLAGGTATYSAGDYAEATELKLVTDRLSGGSPETISFVAAEDNTTFQVSNLSYSLVNKNSLSAGSFAADIQLDASDTSDPNAGWGVDFFTTLHDYNFAGGSPKLFSATHTTAEIGITLLPSGKLQLDVTEDSGSSIASTVSDRVLMVGRRYNVGVGFYRRLSTTTGYLALMINGEVDALIRTNDVDGALSISAMTMGDVTATGIHTFSVDQLHIQNTPIRPETHMQALGLEDVFFQDAQQVPALTGNGASTPKSLTLLHFNEHTGAVVDDLAFWGLPTAEVIVPASERARITRDSSGIMGSAITLNQAGFDVISSADFNDLSTNVAHSLFFYIAAMTPTATADIVNYVSDTDYGYSLQINTDGHLVVNVFEGSSTPVRTEVINGSVLGDFAWHAVAVVFEPAAGRITVQIDAYNTAIMGTLFSDYLTGGNFDRMHVGYGTYMSLDQFTVLEGVLDQSTIDVWRIPTTVKGTPSNEVFVDGIQLAADRVLPVDNRKCYVVMPEHAAGEAHISASFNGVTVSAEQPYVYVASYSREIDQSTIPAGIKRTISPFRVLDTVPDGQVNLAYLDTRDISPDTNIQTIDLSDLDPDNLSNYLQGEFTLTEPAVGADVIAYTGQVDTKDFLISNRSAAWRSGTTPQPLFHKYLAGRGRHYVNVPGAAVTDVDTIRRAILLVDRAGQTYGREEFPWDIEVSNLDKNGNALPSGVFSVCIFTRFAYLEGETVFVSFRAADSLQSFKALPGHREILNTVPIFTQADSTERDTYTLNLQSDATYTVTIRKS